MFPLRDDNPAKTIPLVTWMLIALNVIVFLYQISLSPRAEQLLVYQYGAIPAVVTGSGALSQRIAVIPPFLSLLTNIFLHGGWMHLIGNMWYLWIFGDNVEEAMGRVRYLLFYLLAGLLASISQVFSDAGSAVPCIGASGAISGVLAALSASTGPDTYFSGILFSTDLHPCRIRPRFLVLAPVAERQRRRRRECGRRGFLGSHWRVCCGHAADRAFQEAGHPLF
jgi:hypothetical protein